VRCPTCGEPFEGQAPAKTGCDLVREMREKGVVGAIPDFPDAEKLRRSGPDPTDEPCGGEDGVTLDWLNNELIAQGCTLQDLRADVVRYRDKLAVQESFLEALDDRLRVVERVVAERGELESTRGLSRGSAEVEPSAANRGEVELGPPVGEEDWEGAP